MQMLFLMYCYLFINIQNPLASDFLLFDSGILIYYFHFAAPQPEQVYPVTTVSSHAA